MPILKRQRLDVGRERTTALCGVDPLSEDRVQDEIAGPSMTGTKSLFVRGLAQEIDTTQLASIFSQDFPIKHAFVVVDSRSMQSKGYGFVTFAASVDAERARKALNGSLVANRRITVECADARQRDLATNRHQQRNVSDNQFRTGRGRYLRPEVEAKPTKLIVRNLPPSITDANQLSSLFQSFGKIKQTILPIAKAGASPRFGFIMLRGRKNAEQALKVMNGKEIDGRVLAVDWAVPKPVWQALQAPDPGPKNHGNHDANGTIEVATNETPRQIAFHGTPYDTITDSTNDDLDSEALGLVKPVPGSLRASQPNRRQPNNRSIIFVRNVPFNSTEEAVASHFSTFGRVQYARIVRDISTGRSKGTAFVRFHSLADAAQCLRYAPRALLVKKEDKRTKKASESSVLTDSVLQNTNDDTSGVYTLEGRTLFISEAVESSEASRLTTVRHASREQQDKDKRHLYLLSEGTVMATDPQYSHLAPSEIQLRTDSLKQRQELLKANPSLHLSLRRLSIRNLPRSIDSKALKALARQAVVGFAEDVKVRRRSPLSKEEIRRGGDEDRLAERTRRAKGKGVVKQAKIIFESREGGKIDEKSMSGRSRGYGFVEYYSHRAALMGLRWLNGHAVGSLARSDETAGSTKAPVQQQIKRLIVEFAIENLQVVNRRHGRELRAQQKAKSNWQDMPKDSTDSKSRRLKTLESNANSPKTEQERSIASSTRQRIVGRKRMLRKFRKRRVLEG